VDSASSREKRNGVVTDDSDSQCVGASYMALEFRGQYRHLTQRIRNADEHGISAIFKANQMAMIS
jgi:hypothetical protein